MSASQGRARSDELAALLGPIVEAAGADLEQVAVTPAGRHRVVRVVVDRDGGVDLDAIAELSRLVADALEAPDAADAAEAADAAGTAPASVADRVVGGGAYTLEVTSPGIDRPLTLPRHWRRAAGRLVSVALPDGSVVNGRVVTADEHAVELDVGGDRRTVPLAGLGPGRVQVEFNRAQAETTEDTS